MTEFILLTLYSRGLGNKTKVTQWNANTSYHIFLRKVVYVADFKKLPYIQIALSKAINYPAFTSVTNLLWAVTVSLNITKMGVGVVYRVHLL